MIAIVYTVSYMGVVCCEIELKDADDPIASVIDSFHNTVFSPRIELTQSDINSLDGRSVRQDAKSAIDHC